MFNSIVYVGNSAKKCRLDPFQDSDFAGELEDSKSTSGGTIVRFWKSYICSNKLECARNKLPFSQQFNRIWDYLFGYRIEIWWVACSGVMGSNCFCFLEACLRFQIEQGDLLMLKETKNLKGRSMWWRILILFPQTSNLRVKKALLYVFEDNEAVIKMIIKGRSPTMRHVSRTHRVALGWLFDRINLDTKIQIRYIDTKNQLADILTKGKFHAWWVESFVVLVLNISHFSSTVCSDTMAKRSQQDSGEERVTAKSRPMMSLIARVPSNVSSSTSVSPGKRSYGNQNPWSAIAEKKEGSGRPDIGIGRKKASDNYYHEQFMESFLLSKLLKVGWWPCLVFLRVENWFWVVRAIGETRWNFLESDTRNSTWFLSRRETHHDGTAQSVCEWGNTSWRPGTQQFVIGNDEAELELSVESRSFVNRVNNQVRKKTETNFKCYRRWRKTFCDLVNVHDCNNGISSIHGKRITWKNVNPLRTQQISHSN